MAAVTKGSGRYFYDFERVWTEAKDTGVLPFWVGKAATDLNLPAQPNPQAVQSLADGRSYLGRVQKNRIGCFDATVSFGKSISLLAYGLTPPGEWKGWTETLTGIATPEVEKLLGSQRMNSGAQGSRKIPSQGLAAAFPHWQGRLGQVQAHIHYAIPNVTRDPSGKNGSIANAVELFQAQGVVRARIQKGLDDVLQSRGIETVRVGKNVELAGVPRQLIEELSPARRAMKAIQGAKGFSGPRAQDFYAREARRNAGPRVQKTPDEMHRDCKEAAARHGVTLDSLTKGKPAPARDPAAEMAAAFRVAREAARWCSKKHGSFSAEQFYERLYTRGIGLPTTVQALDEMGRAVLNDRSIAGVRRRATPGGERYWTTRSVRVERAAEKAYRPDSKEAWEAVKDAVKGLGAAAFVATARKASAVVERLAEFVNPSPRRFHVDSAELPRLIAEHRPTPYLLAHAKALLTGIARGGVNPDRMAGHAEQVYARLRSHKRLPYKAVIVVERGGGASARDIRLLQKIAARDGASVILSEREHDALEKLISHSKNRTHNP